MDKTIRKNELCFIGMPSCGVGYESAKSCFLACPSHDKYTLKIEVIKDIVEAKQYECHVALKKIDPGHFAFCTKICSKIIQSQFCIVLLDHSPDSTNSKEHPNPNVHFEYGMMISQNKHIIPLQDEKYNLAFNIAPLDTIKYNDSNFKIKVNESVTNAITRATENKITGPIPQGPEIFTFYNMYGYRMSDIQNNLFKFLYEFGASLGFFLFDNSKDFKYKFIGPFDLEYPQKAILHTKLLIDNLISAYKKAMLGVTDDKKEQAKKNFEYLIRNISIDIIVAPFYQKEEILDKIKKIKDDEFEYPITIYYRNDIYEFVENQYREIGTLKKITPKTK